MGIKDRPSIEIEFYDHVGIDPEDLEWLSKATRRALPECLIHPGSEPPDLPDLKSVEISLVPDETIARVHGDFFDDPTPTDVITFPHGEILVSTETAAVVGPEHGLSPLVETFLYVVHGLLHLNGHIDQADLERREMHKIQNAIVSKISGEKLPPYA